MVPNNDKDRTYAVSYVPKVAGLHKVSPLRPSPAFPVLFISEALAECTPPPQLNATPGRQPPPPTLLSSALSLYPLSELLSPRI